MKNLTISQPTATILDKLADYARLRVAQARKERPFDMVRAEARALPVKTHAFEAAVRAPGLSVISEVKKASPSKSVIDPEFDYRAIARSYEAAGAQAVLCLTEPRWFLGSDEIFCAVRHETTLPMIRKDFYCRYLSNL